MDKGSYAELKVLTDLAGKGFIVSVPYGHNHRYDLIVDINGSLKRIQIKYTKSNGETIHVRCRSLCAAAKYNYKYTSKDIDYIAVYDETINKCFYIKSALLGNGRNSISLRIIESKSGQKKKSLWAKDFSGLVA